MIPRQQKKKEIKSKKQKETEKNRQLCKYVSRYYKYSLKRKIKHVNTDWTNYFFSFPHLTRFVNLELKRKEKKELFEKNKIKAIKYTIFKLNADEKLLLLIPLAWKLYSLFSASRNRLQLVYKVIGGKRKEKLR